MKTLIKLLRWLLKKKGERTSEVDLDQIHRLGSPKDNKVRPTIVKFARYNTRSKVFRNKKKLKVKKVSLTESLTKMQMVALKRRCKEFEFGNVCTCDQRIMYKDVNDNKIKTYCYKEIN